MASCISMTLTLAYGAGRAIYSAWSHLLKAIYGKPLLSERVYYFMKQTLPKQHCLREWLSLHNHDILQWLVRVARPDSCQTIDHIHSIDYLSKDRMLACWRLVSIPVFQAAIHPNQPGVEYNLSAKEEDAKGIATTSQTYHPNEA